MNARFSEPLRPDNVRRMNMRVITIWEDLADLVLERQQKLGYPTLDAAAAALISEGLAAIAEREDHSACDVSP